jgi:hypothetical protein
MTEKERYSIATPNNISTPSASYLYSTFLKTPIYYGVFEKQGYVLASPS